MAMTDRIKISISGEGLATLLGLEDGSFVYASKYDVDRNIWYIYAKSEKDPIPECQEAPESSYAGTVIMLQIAKELRSITNKESKDEQ